MSEDLSRSGNAPTPGRTTDEWIGMLADSEGLTRDEIVERMVASYWTLKEMDGMMEQLEMGGLEGPADEWAAQLESSLSGSEPGGIEALAERVDQLEDDHDAVEQRVIEEFGHLRTIISHLMERTDALEAEGDRDPSGTARNRRREADDKRLTDLKRAAIRHGVSRATCDHCDTPVDMALLPAPDCPECQRRFTSLQPSKRWFGLGTDVLTVGTEDAAGSRADTSVPDDV